MAQLRIQKNKTKSQPHPALQIIFKSSQTYTIENKWKSADVFLVGGGAGGGGGAYASEAAWGTSVVGAGSGYTTTSKLISLVQKAITVTIGAGGQGGYGPNNNPGRGGQTLININNTNITANGGTGMNGGSGAGNKGYTSSKVNEHSGSFIYGGSGGSDGSDGIQGYSRGTYFPVGIGQRTTTRAFGETIETLYAGGGGGGGYHNSSRYNSNYVSPGGGGLGGGGSGGGYIGMDGGSASANTGGGGGGGCWSQNQLAYHDRLNYSGGNGGSGVVILRLYKNNDRPTDIDWSENTIIME